MNILQCEIVELRDAVRAVREELAEDFQVRTDNFIALDMKSARVLAEFAAKWLEDKGVAL